MTHTLLSLALLVCWASFVGAQQDSVVRTPLKKAFTRTFTVTDTVAYDSITVYRFAPPDTVHDSIACPVCDSLPPDTTPPPSGLSQIIVKPDSVSLQTGGTQAFHAYGKLVNGDSVPISPTWSATGGTVSGSGVYTAGGTAGAFRTVATDSGKADTAKVTITAPPPPAQRVGKYVAPNGGGAACTHAAPCSMASLLAGSITGADTIWVRGGTYPIGQNATSHVTGTPAKPQIVRAYPGERATFAFGGTTQGLVVRGSDTWYWGFEFVCQAWTIRRSTVPPPGSNWPEDIPCTLTGVNVFGPRVKFINNVVHDTGDGFDFWKEAVDAELYGNLVYYSGWLGPDRGHGHPIYTQNSSGTKRIRENLTWDAYGNGIVLYGSGSAEVRGYFLEGNAAWNHGAPAGGGYGQILLGGAGGGADITFQQNFCWRPGGAECVRAGYTQTGANMNYQIKDNYIVGGEPSWRLWNLSGGSTFSGNTSTTASTCGGCYINVFGSKPTTWASNVHAGSQTAQVWGWANAGHTWTSFKSTTGLGGSDTYSGAAPSGVKVFVRPNAYEPGRAHVLVFSHSGATSASVNLTAIGLQPGQPYDVRNAQNFYGPAVFSGTGPGSITLPLSGIAKAAIIGTPPNPIQNTGPGFNAFVVVPK